MSIVFATHTDGSLRIWQRSDDGALSQIGQLHTPAVMDHVEMATLVGELSSTLQWNGHAVVPAKQPKALPPAKPTTKQTRRGRGSRPSGVKKLYTPTSSSWIRHHDDIVAQLREGPKTSAMMRAALKVNQNLQSTFDRQLWSMEAVGEITVKLGGGAHGVNLWSLVE